MFVAAAPSVHHQFFFHFSFRSSTKIRRYIRRVPISHQLSDALAACAAAVQCTGDESKRKTETASDRRRRWRRTDMAKVVTPSALKKSKPPATAAAAIQTVLQLLRRL